MQKKGGLTADIVVIGADLVGAATAPRLEVEGFPLQTRSEWPVLEFSSDGGAHACSESGPPQPPRS